MAILDVNHMSPALHVPMAPVAEAAPKGIGEKHRDEVVVSAKARMLHQQWEGRSFEPIRARVREGFYLRSDVLDQTLARLCAEVLPGLSDSSCEDHF